MRARDEVGFRSIATRSRRAMHVLAIAVGIAGCMPMPPELASQNQISQDASASNDDGSVRADGGTTVDAGVSQDAGVTVDAGMSHDAGVTVDAGGSHDAGVTVDAGDAGGSHDAGVAVDAGHDAGPRDAGMVTCGANTFDCGGVAPYPEQPRVPGTSCCCTWGFVPAGDGSCR